MGSDLGLFTGGIFANAKSLSSAKAISSWPSNAGLSVSKAEISAVS